jgi:hypothetical protein
MNLAAALPTPKLYDMRFKLGFDQVTPSKYTLPGSCRDAQNFEVDINGGYTSIAGYEAFDGNPSPSDGTYSILNVTITGTVSVGDTVTGATTSATGYVLEVDTSGAQAYLVLTKITGAFNDASEDLEVAASVEANTDDTAAIGGALTSSLDAQYLNLAADQYRADISAVPGSGGVLGVWRYNDVVYAFRNNAGATAAAMYKETSSGWALVTLSEELAFTSGSTEILVGDVIDGLVGGGPGQATVVAVVVNSGIWGNGDAAGIIVMASHTGTFEAGGIEVSGGGDIATIAGNAATITLLADGRYEFINYTFGGSAQAEKVYGVDGVNRGFEFDGTNFIPLPTGMVADAPKHVVAHKEHLFFSFGGSVQHSGISDPHSWTVITGAGELAMGDTVTGFSVQPSSQGADSLSGSLAIMARNRIKILYGADTASWQLTEYRKEVGAYDYTIQEFGMTLMLDDRGVIILETVQEFGNFATSTISRLIQPFVNERKIKVTGSCIVREKSQYRLFFSDKYALYITTDNNQITGIMPVLFNDKVECSFSLEDSTGNEIMMFGSDDGFVYQMDKGTSFDGDDIEAFFVLQFTFCGSQGISKGYQSATMEVSGSGYAEYNFSFELDYASVLTPQSAVVGKTLDFSSARWDSFVWDSFVWDGQVLTPSRADLNGDAENISLIFKSEADYFTPLTFSGAQVRYTQRKQITA